MIVLTKKARLFNSLSVAFLRTKMISKKWLKTASWKSLTSILVWMIKSRFKVVVCWTMITKTKMLTKAFKKQFKIKLSKAKKSKQTKSPSQNKWSESSKPSKLYNRFKCQRDLQSSTRSWVKRDRMYWLTKHIIQVIRRNRVVINLSNRLI